MDFEGKYVDELIEDRKSARENKDFKLSDEIRNYLDTQLVFIFDMKWGQEVWYLTEKYFERMEHKAETMVMSKRQYVEYRIKEEINLTKGFDAWLYSTKKSAGII